MAYTYGELKIKTVAELREIASGIEHEAVKGYTQLNKEHLLKALCTALGIDIHEHHEAVGVNKLTLKQRIKLLKAEKDKALKDHDMKKVKAFRLKIKKIKNRIRQAEK